MKEPEHYDSVRLVVSANIADMIENGRTYIYNKYVLEKTIEICDKKNILYKIKQHFDDNGFVDYYTLVNVNY